MAKSKYKEEEKVHNQLIDLLKKHFVEDEMEMKEEEMGEMNTMGKKRVMKRGKTFDEDSAFFEDDDDMYDSDSEEDDEDFEEMMSDSEYEDEDEDEYEKDKEQPKLSKDKRKHMAIILATKRAGKK